MHDSIRTAASAFHISVEDWRSFFESKVRKDRALVDAYLSFVSHCASERIPPIFEGRHLAQLLGLSGLELRSLTENPECHYRTFQIPKRSGGFRQIAAPSALLLYCQRWIDSFILRRFEPHASSHGYVSGRSNLTNAQVHIGSAQVLRMDICDFFGSVGARRIIEVYLDFGYPPNVAYLLSRICTTNGVLPQGAASSPSLSNIILSPIDERISAYARERSLKYSRYVDDLTLSGEYVRIEDVHEVDAILRGAGLNINERKTSFQRGHKKIVTGVSIGTGRPRIPRSMKRRFKNSAFLALKRAEDLLDPTDPIYAERVIGQMNYWAMVESDSDKPRAVLEKLRALSASIPRAS